MLRGNSRSAGFYALSFSPVNSNLLFLQDRAAYADGHALFVYIDWLAVQTSLQNQRIGTILLMNALQRAHQVSFHLPIYGVVLRSLNDRTRKKYESHGFVVREESAHPLMILPILTINELFTNPGITVSG